MTWNVWGRFGGNWQRRQRAIADTIHAQRAELVALQETWTADGVSQVDVLGAELGMASTFAPSRMPRDPDPSVRLGLGILSRYPLVAVGLHRLSAEVVALRAEIRLGERSLHFLTTCLDWEEEHQRERHEQAESLRELTSKLSASGDRVLLAGDLDAPPDHPELKSLLSVLRDCGPDRHTYSTHNDYVRPGEWLVDHRIDYILAAPGTPDSLGTCRSWLAGLDGDGSPPSDHYAVVADVPVL